MASFLVAYHADAYRASSPREGGTRDEALRVSALEASIFPIVPDFAHITANCQTLVLASLNIDFGGKWKVRQKLKHAI